MSKHEHKQEHEHEHERVQEFEDEECGCGCGCEDEAEEFVMALLRARHAGSRLGRQLPAYDMQPVTDLVGSGVASLPLDGASLLLAKDGQVIYRQTFGTYSPDTAVPIASGSKWLSATVIMTLVDDGRLGLDDPVSRFLPSFTGDMGQITLRELLSHTSGLPDYHPCLADQSITLADCVEQIAQGGLSVQPGTVFDYSGVGFQVAGRIAEVVAGKPWASLFQERVAGPLGMTGTTYGPSQNPVIAGGVISTLRDYGNLLEMLLDEGAFGSQRILSPASVHEMQRDQTRGVPIVVSVYSDGRRYGLGEWRDVVDAQGNALQLSSQGDTGFSPWIDLQRRLLGVFLVDDSLGDVEALVGKIQQQVRHIVDSTPAGP